MRSKTKNAHSQRLMSRIVKFSKWLYKTVQVVTYRRVKL